MPDLLHMPEQSITVAPSRLPEPDPDVRLARFQGLEVAYQDEASFQCQRKDIFENRIYHFRSDIDRPTIIDGGACIGMAVLYFKTLYPEARIIAFEPDPTLCRIVSENLERNGMSGVEVIAAALDEQRGQAAFVPTGDDSGHLTDDVRAATVPTRRLSEFLDRPVDFVKLNIEGNELPVLREVEASGSLRNIARMVVEYHGLPAGEQRLGPILDLFDRNGFRYLVHDFDAATCPASKPPFRLRSDAPWFCLVYAERIGKPLEAQRSVPS